MYAKERIYLRYCYNYNDTLSVYTQPLSFMRRKYNYLRTDKNTLQFLVSQISTLDSSGCPLQIFLANVCKDVSYTEIRIVKKFILPSSCGDKVIKICSNLICSSYIKCIV